MSASATSNRRYRFCRRQARGYECRRKLLLAPRIVHRLLFVEPVSHEDGWPVAGAFVFCRAVTSTAPAPGWCTLPSRSFVGQGFSPDKSHPARSATPRTERSEGLSGTSLTSATEIRLNPRRFCFSVAQNSCLCSSPRYLQFPLTVKLGVRLTDQRFQAPWQIRSKSPSLSSLCSSLHLWPPPNK